MIQTKTIALATVVVVGAIALAIAGTILTHQALAILPHGDENSHPQEPPHLQHQQALLGDCVVDGHDSTVCGEDTAPHHP